MAGRLNPPPDPHPGLPRWVHKAPPAPSAPLRTKGATLRGRGPPMDYLDNPTATEKKPSADRRRRHLRMAFTAGKLIRRNVAAFCPRRQHPVLPQRAVGRQQFSSSHVHPRQKTAVPNVPSHPDRAFVPPTAGNVPSPRPSPARGEGVSYYVLRLRHSHRRRDEYLNLTALARRPAPLSDRF